MSFQAGYLAAAGSHALTHHVDRLVDDHSHAAAVAAQLRKVYDPDCVVQNTNMIHLDVTPERYAALRAHLAESGIRVGRPRWVFHLDVSAEDADTICAAVARFNR